MIDCSHANSQKIYERQIQVAANIAEQISSGDDRIAGVMIESHLKAGKQAYAPGCELEYGKSITDACLGWEDTEVLLKDLAKAVRIRREKK